MNDLSQFESQLRTWVPRPPSPKLEERLFSPPSAPSDHSLSRPWVAPAIVSVLLLLAVTGQRSFDRAHQAPAGVGMFAMILSNQSAAAYLPVSLEQGQNVPRADTFEWTNGTQSGSNIGSLQPMKLNNQD